MKRKKQFVEKYTYVLPRLLLRRSFSELYQKAIKDAECKPGEDQSGEAWVLDDREEEEGQEEEVQEEQVEEREQEEKASGVGEGNGQPCDGGTDERNPYSLLTLPSLPLLRATSLQDQPTNHSQQDTQRTRSCSLERRPSLREACDG